jgi:hypothetical protein
VPSNVSTRPVVIEPGWDIRGAYPRVAVGWHRCVGPLGLPSADAPLTAGGLRALFDQQGHELAQPGFIEVVHGGSDDVADLGLGQLRMRLLQPGDDVCQLELDAARRHADALLWFRPLQLSKVH